MNATDPIDIDRLLKGSVGSKGLKFVALWDQYTTGPHVLRMICEFANDCNDTKGGYVVIGVDERDGRAVLRPSGLSALDVESAQWWIHDNCTRFDPPYQPQLLPQTVDGQSILVIHAPDSDNKPHCGPYGGNSEQYSVFHDVACASKEIRELSRSPLDEAENMLEEFEAGNSSSSSPQGATNANSHLRNTLICASIARSSREPRNLHRASRLLRGKHFAPSRQDAIDAAILAWRIRDKLMALQFLRMALETEGGDVRALLESARVNVQLAIEACSEHEHRRLVNEARVLFEEVSWCDPRATVKSACCRAIASLPDKPRPVQEFGERTRRGLEL